MTQDAYRIEPLIAQLDPTVRLQAAHIAYARAFAARGMRYSNEDFDIRMGLRGAIGKTEIKKWHRGFVDAWAPA